MHTYSNSAEKTSYISNMTISKTESVLTLVQRDEKDAFLVLEGVNADNFRTTSKIELTQKPDMEDKAVITYDDQASPSQLSVRGHFNEWIGTFFKSPIKNAFGIN